MEEKQAVMDAIEAEKREIARMEHKRETVQTRTPQQYQDAIDSLGTVYRAVHEGTEDEAGWCGMTIMAGPNPRLGGDLSMKIFTWGVTPVGNNFEASCTDFDEQISGPFEELARRVFPIAVQKSRALHPTTSSTENYRNDFDEDEPNGSHNSHPLQPDLSSLLSIGNESPSASILDAPAPKPVKPKKPKRMTKPKKKTSKSSAAPSSVPDTATTARQPLPEGYGSRKLLLVVWWQSRNPSTATPRPCFNGAQFANNRVERAPSMTVGSFGSTQPPNPSQPTPSHSTFRLSPLFNAFRTTSSPAKPTSTFTSSPGRFSSAAVPGCFNFGAAGGQISAGWAGTYNSSFGSQAARALSSLIAPSVPAGAVVPSPTAAPSPDTAPPLATTPFPAATSSPTTMSSPVATSSPAAALSAVEVAPPASLTNGGPTHAEYPQSRPMAKLPTQGANKAGGGQPEKRATMASKLRGRPPKARAAPDVDTSGTEPGGVMRGSVLADSTNTSAATVDPVLIYTSTNNTRDFNRKIDAEKARREKAAAVAKGPVPNLSNPDGETPMVVVSRARRPALGPDGHPVTLPVKRSRAEMANQWNTATEAVLLKRKKAPTTEIATTVAKKHKTK
ncbi:hypothetical protein B0H10DRAFT_2224844 [Mycena sp. CBHHK59/15]|nr:hypothetical protein B0H10DRAFT_2224844 [Mycena sp. CBHHK59/15]